MKKLLFLSAFLLIATNLFSVPKMSGWDGIAYVIKDYIKENANDPGSIEYINSSIMTKFNNGLYCQRVKFRGKNAFGALVLNEYYFIIEKNYGNEKIVKSVIADEFTTYIIKNKIEIIAKYNTNGSLIP